MGFHKTYLPDLPELKILRSKFSCDEDFLKKIIGKSEALIGPSDSMRYIENIEESIKQKNRNVNL
jgi:hypothetical protein